MPDRARRCFVRALKRRKVFRIAVVYLVAHLEPVEEARRRLARLAAESPS